MEKIWPSLTYGSSTGRAPNQVNNIQTLMCIQKIISLFNHDTMKAHMTKLYKEKWENFIDSYRYDSDCKLRTYSAFKKTLLYRELPGTASYEYQKKPHQTPYLLAQSGNRNRKVHQTELNTGWKTYVLSL